MREMGICKAILTGYADIEERREEIFDFTKYPAEPNWDAYNQYMDSTIQCCIQKLAEQERQRITDFIGKGKGGANNGLYAINVPMPRMWE